MMLRSFIEAAEHRLRLLWDNGWLVVLSHRLPNRVERIEQHNRDTLDFFAARSAGQSNAREASNAPALKAQYG